jgi:hypothetical protein
MQWCSTISQESAEAGRVPSWASVAVPENVTTSPTFHRELAAGEVMVTVGGVFGVALTENDHTLSAASGLRLASVAPPAPPLMVAT